MLFGSGLCSEKLSAPPLSQVSHSFWVVRITGIAFGCIGLMMSFGSVVRNAYNLQSSARRLRRVAPSTSFNRSPVQGLQIPAKKGVSTFISNQLLARSCLFHSANREKGTRHRYSGASMYSLLTFCHHRLVVMFRMFVMGAFRRFDPSFCGSAGKPHLIVCIDKSRPWSRVITKPS